MTVVIDGSLGIDTIQDGAVSTAAKLAAGIVTPPKLNGAQSGNPPIYGCRAWAVFTGSTGVILASGNIASITRNSAGQYAVVFTTAMPSANYAVVGGASASGAAIAVVSPFSNGFADSAPTAAGFNLAILNNAAAHDATVTTFAVFC